MKIENLVLLVEDDALVLMAAEDMIADGGFTVESVMYGDAAIKLLTADIGMFCALVTDVRLGKGPSGWDVARHARTLNPLMPVIYVTGDSAHEWAANGVPQSIMISKPYVQAQLLTALANLLNAVHLSGGSAPATS